MGIDTTIVFRRHLQRGKQIRGLFLFECKCVQVWRGVSWFVREKPYNQARCVHYGPPTDAHTKATQQPPVRTDQALSRGPLLSIDSLGEKGGTFVAVRSRARRPAASDNPRVYIQPSSHRRGTCPLHSSESAGVMRGPRACTYNTPLNLARSVPDNNATRSLAAGRVPCAGAGRSAYWRDLRGTRCMQLAIVTRATRRP